VEVFSPAVCGFGQTGKEPDGPSLADKVLVCWAVLLVVENVIQLVTAVYGINNLREPERNDVLGENVFQLLLTLKQLLLSEPIPDRRSRLFRGNPRRCKVLTHFGEVGKKTGNLHSLSTKEHSKTRQTSLTFWTVEVRR